MAILFEGGGLTVPMLALFTSLQQVKPGMCEGVVLRPMKGTENPVSDLTAHLPFCGFTFSVYVSECMCMYMCTYFFTYIRTYSMYMYMHCTACCAVPVLSVWSCAFSPPLLPFSPSPHFSPHVSAVRQSDYEGVIKCVKGAGSNGDSVSGEFPFSITSVANHKIALHEGDSVSNEASTEYCIAHVDMFAL